MLGMSPPWHGGGTPEARPGSSHRCFQGAGGGNGQRETRLPGSGCANSPLSGKPPSAPRRDGDSPASAGHLLGSHPGPCPVRQDLSPLPGCHLGG